MTSLKSMTLTKAHDRKHYLDNQSEDSSKGYLREGCYLQCFLAKVNENMHIQKPGENLILRKTARPISANFSEYAPETYTMPKNKIIILQFIPD